MSSLRFALVAGPFSLLAVSAAAEVNELGYELGGVEFVTATPEQIEAGKSVYQESCAQCHGDTGDGKGTMADRVYPKPRDFIAGSYKIRHTFGGELPTDHDLYEAVRLGLPGTSMPAWEGLLSEDQIWQVVHYIKTFSEDFEHFPPEEQLVIGEPIPTSEESVERGRQVYGEMQCAKCHGEQGRGNGPSAAELKDEWNERTWPVDMMQPWTFRGGRAPGDVYRTFVTGLNGTPMPSYAPSVSSEDAWHLTNYVISVGREPVRDIVVRGVRVDAIPADPAAPEWAEAPMVDFKLSPQIIQKPRLFTLVNLDVSAKALYDGEEVAVQLIWDDRTENAGGDGLPSDAAAIQFPARPAEGGEKPYFLMGDDRHPVDYWRWSALMNTADNLLAHGANEVERKESGVNAQGAYDDGRYQVIFRRAMTTDHEQDVQFEPGAFLPIAFNVWDGANEEQGNRKAVTAWYYLLLEPETPRTVFAWPLVAIFLGLGAEALLLRRLRRAEPGPEPPLRQP
jgi:DMSO reductase family type II enzyme heme b subunit